MTRRPTIWRSPTMRARGARERRQRDVAGMRKMADAFDAHEAERLARAADEARHGGKSPDAGEVAKS